MAVLAVAAVVHASDARAEDADLERARTLFDEAGELERRGQWSAAADKLRAALKIRETPQLRYALGWALENDDKLIEARAEYDIAERNAAKGAEDVSALARARIAELEKKTPVVRVLVAGATRSSARVVVDGREAALQNDVATVPVNPGARVVRIERAGAPPTEKIVYVSRGESRTVDISGTGAAVTRREMASTSDAASDTRDAGSDAHRGPGALPWVLVGGGAALGAGALALFVSSASDANERDDRSRAWCEATACVAGTTATVAETPEAASYRQQAEDAAARGNTKQVVGAVVGGAGLVSAAIGVILLVKGGDREGAPKTPTAVTSRRSMLRFVGGPTRDGAMAGAAFTF